jgi:hypothetical protein
MQEGGAHLEHAPVPTLGDPAPHTPATRIEGQLG